MKISNDGLALIMGFEGLELKAYKCPAGVWTIGFGTTIYPNGQKVSPRDIITKEKAEEYLRFIVSLFENDVNSLTKTAKLTQHQFDALVSFAYNVGSDIDIDIIPEGLGDSTLLKKVLAKSSDPTIAAEFHKWNKGGGKVLPGLVKRRAAEATLYFKA